MNYEYCHLVTAVNSLEVPDPAQCCIQVIDSLDRHYYLIIQTILGVTKTIEYGPIYPDIDKLEPYVGYIYKEFDCNLRKIDTIIEKFLSRDIKQDGASVITLSEAKKIIKNPLDYFIEVEDE